MHCVNKEKKGVVSKMEKVINRNVYKIIKTTFVQNGLGESKVEELQPLEADSANEKYIDIQTIITSINPIISDLDNLYNEYRNLLNSIFKSINESLEENFLNLDIYETNLQNRINKFIDSQKEILETARDDAIRHHNKMQILLNSLKTEDIKKIYENTSTTSYKIDISRTGSEYSPKS